MDQQLNKLRKTRRELIKHLKANNTKLEGFLTTQYPDNAHFIYELLQNAEDPHATTARFKLTSNKIEFEHDGKKLFNYDDVESITNIGASTKVGDHTSIGQHGVGFKAVFAYTDTPEIHSGKYHFRIHDLVVPEEIDKISKVKKENLGTHFVFPFNKPQKKAKDAVKEVERSLCGLGENTLLFLAHVRKIEYQLPAGKVGSQERIEHPDNLLEICTHHHDGKNSITHWLRFQKDVQITKDDGSVKSCQIAIAYSLQKNKGKKKNYAEWKVVPLDHSQVSIFFPAEKEVSNLKFHLHAPFASTPARDCVRDCMENTQLRDHISKLVVESLFLIRDKDMLTMDFLEVLPCKEDTVTKFYRPISEAIVNAFQRKKLTPTISGSYAPAAGLFKGPANISKVLNDNDLVLLTQLTPNNPPMWVVNPSGRRARSFLNCLKMTPWGWSELVNSIRRWPEDEDHVPIKKWLSQKDDPWMMSFYALLRDATTKHHQWFGYDSHGIVRVGNNVDFDHVLPKYAFFPPECELKLPEDVCLVKSSVYSAGSSKSQKELAELAHEFLKHIDVLTFDEEEALKLKLEHCDEQDPQLIKSYLNDLKVFISFWKKNPGEERLFNSQKFLLGMNKDGEQSWYEPHQLFLDKPYLKTDLSKLPDTEMVPLSGEYKNKLPDNEVDDFVGFMKAVGVKFELNVIEAPIYFNQEYLSLLEDSSRVSQYERSKDYTIEGLEGYLEKPSIPISRLIWNALINAGEPVAKACYRANAKSKYKIKPSQLVCHLRDTAWIPNESGAFHKPSDITSNDLLTDFLHDDRNGLFSAIGFGDNSKKNSKKKQASNKVAQDMGYDNAKQMRMVGQAFKSGDVTEEDIAELVDRKNSQPLQPEDSVPNPSRRRKAMQETIEDRPNKESVKRERSVQRSTQYTEEDKVYLRNKYTNSDGQLICQCCHNEMPFKVKGEYYFEAVQYTLSVDKPLPQNRLALCPTCAAMYQHAREVDDDELSRLISEYDDSAKKPHEITIKLAGVTFNLRFVDSHFLDLQTLFGK
jgi:hypothetical protein